MAQARALAQPELVQQELCWVRRCREGDEIAMESIIGLHRRRLIRTAYNVLRDAHEAEDVAQEAFLKAFRELGKLRDDRAFSSFLYRICVRLCLDRLRLRRAEPAEFDRSTESQGRQIETRILVEKLLKRLSPELRTTLVLREMEQLSYEEISEIMHVPVGTVRSRLHAGREKFRKIYLSASEGEIL
jgi:RNA polymerase sigma-70 factor (ECF subfamily)